MSQKTRHSKTFGYRIVKISSTFAAVMNDQTQIVLFFSETRCTVHKMNFNITEGYWQHYLTGHI